MRWSSVLLPFSLLFAGVFADDPSERFVEFQKKALSSSPVKLDDASYKKITAAPRDYSIAVLLTAQDARYGCQMCREFGPELDLLSTQWTKGDKAGNSRVLFALLDFNDGRDTFMSLGLQTAPVLLFFQPTTGEFAVPDPDPLRYDFNSGKPSAEALHEWIVRHTPGRPHPQFKRPTDWFMMLSALVIITGVGTLIYTTWSYTWPWLSSRALWRFLVLFSVLIFTSGQMFNQIRNTPYVGQDGRGHISYIAGGFQSQFAIETQIIGVLYGALALMAIALADKVPRMGSPSSQNIAVLAYAGVMLVLYSFLLSVFRVKNGGYPFSLPPFL